MFIALNYYLDAGVNQSMLQIKESEGEGGREGSGVIYFTSASAAAVGEFTPSLLSFSRLLKQLPKKNASIKFSFGVLSHAETVEEEIPRQFIHHKHAEGKEDDGDDVSLPTCLLVVLPPPPSSVAAAEFIVRYLFGASGTERD